MHTTFGAPARPETQADRAEFLAGGLAPLACRSCGARVLVKKNSHKHTSIQWTSDPASVCPYFAAGADDPAKVLDSCGELLDTIAKAAADGQIDVGSVDVGTGEVGDDRS